MNRSYYCFSVTLLISDFVTMKSHFQIETLSDMAPSLLAVVGVLLMNDGDVGWKMLLVRWLEHRPLAHREIVTRLCDVYIQPIVHYLCGAENDERSVEAKRYGLWETGSRSSRCIYLSILNMVNTFTVLLEVSCFLCSWCCWLVCCI